MKYSINLLPKKEAPLAEQVMYFSLNYLRYIIVITQLVVIGVFFYRFQIDQQIIDLKESVDQKKEIVQVVNPLLTEAEIITKRTATSEDVIQTQTHFTRMVNYFLAQFPESATLSDLKLDTNSLTIAGTTTDLPQLQSFYSLLKTEKKFKVVDLSSIKKTDYGYDFNLKLANYE